jgi:hypothetical protein
MRYVQASENEFNLYFRLHVRKQIRAGLIPGKDPYEEYAHLTKLPSDYVRRVVAGLDKPNETILKMMKGKQLPSMYEFEI